MITKHSGSLSLKNGVCVILPKTYEGKILSL